jgi:hypothetical protein
MPFDPRAGQPRDGFVFVENPACPGEVGEIPLVSLDHYSDLGWHIVRSEYHDGSAPDLEQIVVTDSPAPVVEQPAPEGDPTPSEEDK